MAYTSTQRGAALRRSLAGHDARSRPAQFTAPRCRLQGECGLVGHSYRHHTGGCCGLCPPGYHFADKPVRR